MGCVVVHVGVPRSRGALRRAVALRLAFETVERPLCTRDEARVKRTAGAGGVPPSAYPAGAERGTDVDVIEHNRAAWNRESAGGGEWSRPVTAEVVAAARAGAWSVVLTPTKPVPAAWFGDPRGKDVLCLASGGGQQAPVLAAAGATVVSYDLSEEQLAQDRAVAEREGLALHCVRGDMADLAVLPSKGFDLVFHPVSNVFVPDVMPVRRECHRVLRSGGRLLAGMLNPCFFLFDHDEAERGGALLATYPQPYAEPDSLSGDALRRRRERGGPAEFGHSLEAQTGGQAAAGLAVVGLYEEPWTPEATPLARFFAGAFATLAVKAGERRRGVDATFAAGVGTGSSVHPTGRSSYLWRRRWAHGRC